MPAFADEASEPESVELSWSEPCGQVVAVCWFELGPMLHVIRKHITGEEPWSRIVGSGLEQRLVQAGRQARLPAKADCREFVQALTAQLRASCSRPLLCRFLETLPPAAGDREIARGPSDRHFSAEKVLFVLPSGAVAFVREIRSAVPDVLVVVLVTAFFPRQSLGWRVQRRAAEASAERYILRWTSDWHPSGGRLLPAPGEALDDIDDDDDAAIIASRLRFISPASWGFRRQADGRWAWA